MIPNGMSNWVRLDRPSALSRYLKNASIELHEQIQASIPVTAFHSAIALTR
jgi:hypothetical protein